MIKVTNTNGEVYLVNPQHIVYIKDQHGNLCIETVRGSIICEYDADLLIMIKAALADKPVRIM